MKTADLIPREPKRMKQPRKDTLREQLIAAQEVIRQQRALIESLSTPWWRRIFKRTTP